MATSGTTVWQQTRDDLIAAALRKLTVIGEGESPNANQLSTGQAALNSIILAYQSLGMFLWKRVEREISFVLGQDEYVLGVGQTINTPYPYKVHQAIVEYSGGAQVDMELIPHFNFNLLPKYSTGIPIKGSYQPKNNQGVFYVWPTPDASAVANNTLLITYQQPFDIFTSATETVDFPQEWYLPLVYGLADVLADEYALPLEDRRRIEKQAEKYLSIVMGGAGEDTSAFFFPVKEG